MNLRRVLAILVGCLLSLSTRAQSVSTRRREAKSSAKRQRGKAPKKASTASTVPTELVEHLSLAGKILPFLQEFAITRDKARKIYAAVSEAVDLKEFFLLGLIGWAAVPFIRSIYNIRQFLVARAHDENQEEEDHTSVDDKSILGLVRWTAGWTYSRFNRAMKDAKEKLVNGSDNGATVDEKVPAAAVKAFETTYLYHSVHHISQAAQIGALAYVVDCLAITLNSMGFKYRQQAGFSKKAMKVTYTVWAALRISALKSYLLSRALKKNPDGLGRTRLYDRLLNFVLSVVTGGFIFDMFDVDFGLALKSLLTFGGVGTLVLSLASKDLASELVSGLALSTSDRFLEGDEIELGDSTAGIITHMGLAYTDIRGYDEVIARIPNSQLANQRARNLSRVSRSQVKQTLWFSYKDMDKMSMITEAIKDEIRESCPELITDGSRPFRAHWREFKDDHLEVVVDCHFTIKAATNAYWDNRMKVLEAIARAVKKLGITFTLPSRICTA